MAGSSAQTIPGQGWVTVITFDPVGRKLYWVDYDANMIRRSDPDGTNIEDVAATEADAGHLAISIP